MIRGLILAIAALMFAQPASAANLTVSGGELVGATNLLIDGKAYNLELVEGTCAQVFGQCDSNAAFTFKTRETALIAGRAIVDQVLIDGAQGNFKSDYTKTFGCEPNNVFFTGGACFIYLPYSVNSANIPVIGVFNSDVAGGNESASAGNAATPTLDTTGQAHLVWARFTAVPEPSSWALLIAGFAAIGGAARLRKPAVKAALR
jgi:hypothetical protein